MSPNFDKTTRLKRNVHKKFDFIFVLDLKKNKFSLRKFGFCIFLVVIPLE